MKQETYQQCELRKNNTVITTWILSKFAEKGKIVKLKVKGEWVEGWTVVTIGGVVVTQKKLSVLQAQYGWTREASDI